MKIFSRFAIFLALLFVTSLVFANIKLIKADSYTMSHYGFSSDHRNFVIKVKNLGYHKNISMWAEHEDGEWIESGTAEYKGPAEDGWEIWTMFVSNSGSYYTSDYRPINHWEGEFVLKYEVNGDTYWDNNDGMNYDMGLSDGEMLADDVNVFNSYASAYYMSYSDKTSFTGNVLIKNLDYHKNVEIVYTTDDGASWNVASCNFVSSYTHSYGSTIRYPNAHDVERWGFNVEVSSEATSIRYAIKYAVDGEEYWDNNFGRDYTIEVNGRN